jgi:hypothetical protein
MAMAMQTYPSRHAKTNKETISAPSITALRPYLIIYFTPRALQLLLHPLPKPVPALQVLQILCPTEDEAPSQRRGPANEHVLVKVRQDVVGSCVAPLNGLLCCLELEVELELHTVEAST